MPHASDVYSTSPAVSVVQMIEDKPIAKLSYISQRKVAHAAKHVMRRLSAGNAPVPGRDVVSGVLRQHREILTGYALPLRQHVKAVSRVIETMVGANLLENIGEQPITLRLLKHPADNVGDDG